MSADVELQGINRIWRFLCRKNVNVKIEAGEFLVSLGLLVVAKLLF